jgi:hypothetical protein
MYDTSRPRVYSAAELETRQLILHVRKRKWRYLVIAVLLGSYFFYLFKYEILEYSSTASFIINDHSNVITSLGIENFSTGDNYNRIYELINSAATQRYLIKKFNLIHHYGIDTTREFYYQKAIETIRSHISVAKTPFNTITVTVHDRYRYLPADMANEIVSYVENLNQNYFLNTLRTRVQLTEAYVAQLEKDNRQKSIAVDSMIRNLNKIITSGRVSEQAGYNLLGQQERLNDIIVSYRQSSTELMNSQKMHNLALQAMNFQSFPTITVLQTAMPAFRSIVYKALLYSMGAMIAVFLLLVLQGYFFMQYKDYIRLILTGK